MRAKTWSIGIILVMVVALTSVILLSFYRQVACEGQLLNHEFEPSPEQQVWGDRVVSQSFVAPRDGLSRIAVMFLTFQRQNRGEVSVRLLEAPADEDNPLMGTEQFRGMFEAAEVSDQEWVTFDFAPINDSAGKTYLITIEARESVKGQTLAAAGIQKDVYKPGGAHLGVVPLRADITFQTCYELTPLEKFTILANQLTRQRPSFAGSVSFYAVIFVIYVALLLGLFWQMAHQAAD